MTEVLPVSGRTCSEGHLHHDLDGPRRDRRRGQRQARRGGRDRHRRDHAVLPVPRMHAGAPLQHSRPRPASSRRTARLRARRHSGHVADPRQGRAASPSGRSSRHSTRSCRDDRRTSIGAVARPLPSEAAGGWDSLVGTAVCPRRGGPELLDARFLRGWNRSGVAVVDGDAELRATRSDLLETTFAREEH